MPLVLPSTLDLQLLEAFVLMQKANAGESPAQHELGLRYLFGKGFPADTAKAAYWIQKAADQHLMLAQYNLGILSMNGRGVEWNPFKAFECFHAAAEQGNPEALYVVGLMYTEDLIVPRSWPTAYSYFTKAAVSGSEAGKSTKKEMERRGLNKSDTANTTSAKAVHPDKSAAHPAKIDTSTNLLFIDFHTDTTSTIEDTTLIREAYQGIDTLSPSAAAPDLGNQSFLSKTAMSGNPEALCLLGRCYEHGLNVPRDVILAGVYYLRAFILNSNRAPALLWKLMNTDDFARELELRSSKNDAEALYVWAGLTSIGFSKVLNEKQALNLLQRAAAAGHVPSMVELGSCHFTGRWVKQNREKAVEWWSRASSLGSVEADIRLAAANVLGQIHTQDIESSISLLRNTAKEGSLLSDLTLARCYEKGIVLSQNKGESYRIFHKSMLRGSETAYVALRSMHDEIRPPAREYQMPD
ncbi:MAG: sel1 repeat family protein [Ignavibacteriae bacterium]|nr:MAG: sel1 repeat family protein [Ignavibacteriota bacterium]